MKPQDSRSVSGKHGVDNVDVPGLCGKRDRPSRRSRFTREVMRAPKIRKDGAESLHELAIRSLIDGHADMCRNGFQHSIRQLWDELYPCDPEDREDVPAVSALPDAFRIDRANSDILLYEVEDTNPVSADKLRLYAGYWFEWDCDSDHNWLPRLFIVDRYGTVSIEIDLRASYYALVADSASVEPFPKHPLRKPQARLAPAGLVAGSGM